MSGKGSRPRPFSVDHETFSGNWDRIFTKQKPKWICLHCGADRFQEPCRLNAARMIKECPMVGVAYSNHDDQGTR